MKTNQKGFGVLEILLIIFLIGVIGLAGWQLSKRKAVTPSATQNTAASAQKDTSAANEYLVISEWGVKLKLSDNIAHATYKITRPELSGKETAFLSTKELDSSPTCQQYFSASKDMPSFQYIAKYDPSDKVAISDSDLMSASDAVKSNPEMYILIGSHVYGYGTGNGFSCSDDTDYKATKAFTEAFKTLNNQIIQTPSSL